MVCSRVNFTFTFTVHSNIQRTVEVPGKSQIVPVHIIKTYRGEVLLNWVLKKYIINQAGDWCSSDSKTIVQKLIVHGAACSSVTKEYNLIFNILREFVIQLSSRLKQNFAGRRFKEDFVVQTHATLRQVTRGTDCCRQRIEKVVT
jgi:hypothetical protein